MADTDTPFVWGAGGEALSPGQLSARRRIADAMMAQGMDASPIRSPWQGVDRMAKAVFGAYQGRQADEQEATARQAAVGQLMAVLGGGQGAGMPVAAAAPPAAVSASPVAAVPGPAPALGPDVAPGIAPARARVASSGKVWGDDEAEAAGIYEPAAGSSAVKTVATAMTPTGNQAPAVAGPPVVPPPAAGVRPGVGQLMAAMSNPFLPPGMAQIAAAYAKPREQHTLTTDADGNVWDVNMMTGQRSVALKKDPSFGAPFKDEGGNLVQRDGNGKISVLSAAEKAPTSVAEHEHYLQKFKPTATRPEPMDYETWSTAKARAAATTVNVNGGGGTDKQIFDAFDERSKVARSAAAGLAAITNARGAINGDGGSITGSGADFRLGLQKAAAQLGLADADKVINTETFRAAIAPQIASVLKATVGTANISDSDRRFAEKAAGGSIELDKGSINRLLDIMERASTNHLKQYQEQIDAVYPDAVAHKRERALFGVPMPALAPAAPPVAVAPSGVTSTGRKWSAE